MDDSAYEAELRRRLEILRDAIDNGRIHFAPHLVDEVKRSLSAVRYGNDGKVDLSTVDARVRSIALAVAVTRDREDMKNAISLRDIQHAYFDWVENTFGHFYTTMLERQLTPHEAARQLSSLPDFLELTKSALPEFIDVVKDFWSRVLEPGHAHIEDLRGSKAVFGGDLFPAYARNIAWSCPA